MEDNDDDQSICCCINVQYLQLRKQIPSFTQKPLNITPLIQKYSVFCDKQERQKDAINVFIWNETRIPCFDLSKGLCCL